MKKRLRPVTFQFPRHGIYIFTSSHGQDFSMAAHRSEYHELTLVRRGAGQLTGPGRTIPLGPNDLILIPPGVTHRFVDSRHTPLTLTLLCFRENIFDRSGLPAANLTELRRNVSNLCHISLANEYRRNFVYESLQHIINEQTFRRTGYQTVIQCVLFQLLVFLLRLPHESTEASTVSLPHDAIMACREFMEKHFNQPVLVSRLARLTPYSSRRLATLFKEQTGQTLHEYLTNLRIDYARKRLAESTNILQIALEAGFNDLSTFYRAFKKRTGLTPKSYLIGQRPSPEM